jgi:hypothetical protein
MPVHPQQPPPADPGMIALTVPEVLPAHRRDRTPLAARPRRALVRLDAQSRARACRFHHRARLARDQNLSMKPLAS